MVKKIMVIDDEEKLGKYIKSVLEQYSCRVTHILDGKRGLELIKKEQPDLILLDLLLPGIHGLELCKIIKKDDRLKHIPVITMSAVYGKVTAEMESRKSGADDFLEKPMNFGELLGKIKKFIEIQPGQAIKNGDTPQAKIQYLQNLYGKELPGKVTELEAIWRFLQEKPGNRESLTSFHQMAHKLNGSGATFGFQEISNHARELETVLANALDKDEHILEREKDRINGLLDRLRYHATAPGKKE
jgi:DNA-binding response OmpR family regulator